LKLYFVSLIHFLPLEKFVRFILPYN